MSIPGAMALSASSRGRALFFRWSMLIPLLGLLALAGCAPQSGPRVDGDGGQSATLWSAFLAHSDKAPAPSRVDGSLRFGPRDDTRRVTYILWNNGGLPLRMDVQAGVGVVAAHVEVNDDVVLAYLPREQRAFIGTDSPDKALRSLGLPLPLSVGQLNSFILGRYWEALGRPEMQSQSQSAQGNAVFRLRGSTGSSSLELDASARPLRWVSPENWDVAITYGPDGLPARIEAVLPATSSVVRGEDYRVVLLVKKREALPPFSPADLRLNVPEGTPVYNLDT